MNPLDKHNVGRGARDDAQNGLDSSEERIVAELGERRPLDPIGNPEHAAHVAALDTSVIEELREDVRASEGICVGYTSPGWLLLGLVVAVAIELVGAQLILRTMDVAPGERFPLALALAIALIGVTAALANRTAARQAAEGDKGGYRRSLATAALYLFYAVIVVAITVVRMAASIDGDASLAEVLAQSLLLLLTSIGPAWAAETLMAKHAPAIDAYKRLRLLRGRLAGAERAHGRAQRAVHRIAREAARWDVEAAKRRAHYRVVHRLEGAKGDGR